MRMLLLAALLIVASGCGGSTRFPIVPVKGKIAFTDGKPLPAGTVLVFNAAEGKVDSATATTDAEGNFTVIHAKGQPGAEACNYTIALRAPKDNPGDFFRIVPDSVAEGKVLSAEVKAGMAPLDLKVAPAKKK